MKIEKLPRDPGPAGWNELLAKPAPAQPLETNITADWLVIGAGFAGLAAARRLGQICNGDRIVVLDAVRVGEGPAGRNSGFMIDLPHDLSSNNYSGSLNADHEQTVANRAAIAFALEAAQEYELPEEAIVQSGKINAAASGRGLKHNAVYADHLVKLDEAHETYDTQTMREITGSSYFRSGLYTPNTAVMQPAVYVRGVADGLSSRHVTIHENSPVISMVREGNAWRVETPRGCVSAAKVILAVNGHAESFGHFRRRLMHVFTYASMTRALSASEINDLGGLPVWGITPADPMGATIRRVSGTGGHRIVVRSRFTYDPSMEVSDARINSVVRDHDRAFAARFPTLKGVDMAYRWGGRLCLSRNNVPAFGEVEEGLIVASCQNGLGTAKGTYSGVAAADMAAGLDSSFVQYLTSLPQPAGLPPEPLTWIGANAVMRWGEYKAGKEL